MDKRILVGRKPDGVVNMLSMRTLGIEPIYSDGYDRKFKVDHYTKDKLLNVFKDNPELLQEIIVDLRKDKINKILKK